MFVMMIRITIVLMNVLDHQDLISITTLKVLILHFNMLLRLSISTLDVLIIMLN